MPCYEVNLITTKFQATQIHLLEQAAKDLNLVIHVSRGYVSIGGVTINLDTQTAMARSQDDINALKRAYSGAAVRQAAKAKGWTLSQWTTKAGNKTTTATKY